MPYGPEISWPYGFRQIDDESREVLESAYGTGPGYQQPAIDDFGYGDPGYSDPSYDGPRTPYGPVYGGQGGGSPSARSSADSGYRPSDAGPPGYHVPEVRDPGRTGGYPSPGYQPRDYAPPSGGQDIWPVTGAQEALPGTGPQPAADTWGTRGSAAYPEQWYGHPRLEDRTQDHRTLDNRTLDNRTPGDRAADDKRRDPRLEGINYGELRYDDSDPVAPGETAHDEPLDDESWYQELRRSAPAYLQHPGQQGLGQQGPGQQRRADPLAPGYGQSPGYSQAPDRPAGYGQTRGDWGGPDRNTPTTPSGPQMSAGRTAGPGPRPGGQPGPALPPGPAAQGTGFLAAPVGPVGVLTPPSGTRVDANRVDATRADATRVDVPRVDALRDGGRFPAAPAASPRSGNAPVRPGHGLDGPAITSSWPAQPAGDDLDSYDDFWRDDEDEEYSGLFGDREAEFQRADAKQAASRRSTGRRRGGSNDHRLWLGLGGVVVLAAAAIIGVVKFEFPSHTGPAHAIAAPNKIGTYVRTVDLEHQADVGALRAKVMQMSSGQASHVVTAVYESGKSSVGNTAQIVMFVGGHLANADPAASVASFIQQYKGAEVVSAGPMGGKAACYQEGTKANGVGWCVWFDNDSFGELSSPTMSATALANVMRTFRPSVESLAAK